MTPLYRVFPWRPEAAPGEPGGALFVHRLLQGGGRHDNPHVYGALYLSRHAHSAVAERLRRLAATPVADRRFVFQDGRRLALAALDDRPLGVLTDLDDPRALLDRSLRPSMVATRDRQRTQEMALSLFDEGGPGFAWWSAIEAAWVNVTLFAERAVKGLDLLAEPEPLTVGHPAVREAAAALDLRLA